MKKAKFCLCGRRSVTLSTGFELLCVVWKARVKQHATSYKRKGPRYTPPPLRLQKLSPTLVAEAAGSEDHGDSFHLYLCVVLAAEEAVFVESVSTRDRVTKGPPPFPANLKGNLAGRRRIPVLDCAIHDVAHPDTIQTPDSPALAAVHFELDLRAGGSGGKFIRGRVVGSDEVPSLETENFGSVDVRAVKQIELLEHRVDGESLPGLQLTGGGLQKEAKVVVRLLRRDRAIVVCVSVDSPRTDYEAGSIDLEDGLERFADAREALQVDVLELLAHEDPKLGWNA